MYNEIEYFRIDPRILNIDDERINNYKQGKWNQEQLLLSITENDPFIIEFGMLKYLGEGEKKVYNYTKRKADQISKLDPLKIWDERDKWLEKFSALENVINNINQDFELCEHKSIAKYRRVAPLVEEIIKLELKL